MPNKNSELYQLLLSCALFLREHAINLQIFLTGFFSSLLLSIRNSIEFKKMCVDAILCGLIALSLSELVDFLPLFMPKLHDINTGSIKRLFIPLAIFIGMLRVDRIQLTIDKWLEKKFKKRRNPNDDENA